MKAFQYVKASDEGAAHAAGLHAGAEFIAGGTGMVDLMRLHVQRPDELVDINALPWAQIVETEQGLRVGALVRNTELAYHPQVQEHYPALSQALLSGASAQLRNMATVGGNLLQRTRCPYFRDVGVGACNKRAEGSGCAALDGYTRSHAVLGGSDRCIAVHPSDMAVAMLALDAQVETTARTLPLADLHTLPAQTPAREHVLAHGELIRSVLLPRSAFAARSVYVKARDRASYAFALASAAVALSVREGKVAEARVALGGVATKPWRAREAEQVLVGQAASPALFERAAQAALHDARPVGSNGFKVELARRVIVRALEQAVRGV